MYLGETTRPRRPVCSTYPSSGCVMESTCHGKSPPRATFSELNFASSSSVPYKSAKAMCCGFVLGIGSTRWAVRTPGQEGAATETSERVSADRHGQENASSLYIVVDMHPSSATAHLPTVNYFYLHTYRQRRQIKVPHFCQYWWRLLMKSVGV